MARPVITRHGDWRNHHRHQQVGEGGEERECAHTHLPHVCVLTDRLQSKHLVNIFQEAKSAYRERKAEIQAERNAALQEKQLRDGMRSIRLDDEVRSRASSRHSKHPKSHRGKSHRSQKPPFERGFTDSFYVNDDSPRRSKHRYEQDLAGDARDGHMRELTRRNTDYQLQTAPPLRETRSRSESHIDMDLAYGELPPPLPSKKYNEGELRQQASKLTMLLEEANCLQHSATTIIENLQKNPDALAAVALTLGEISAMVGKMGPGVLTTLKASFPAVVALLASPQFLVAAGVGLGVTIVALGGYKIIKKVQAQKEDEKSMMMEEPYQLDELEPPELGRIELWRRGIADVEAESAGTTVDGEFITPGASRQLVAAGVLDEDDLKSRRSERRSKSHHAKSTRTSKSAKSSASRSKTVKEKTRKKEPSLMKTLFRSHTTG